MIMMLFSLSFEGHVREQYLSLPLCNIGEYEDFEYAFKKRWSSDVEGAFILEKFYHMKKKGKEDFRECTQMFDKIVRDILDHLKPLDAVILDKFTKAIGGHLIYKPKDKMPKTLAEANEIVIEVEHNLNASKIKMFVLVFVASDGILVSKLCREAKTQEFFKTQKLFMEIPPRDSSIKLIDHHSNFSKV